LGSIWQAEKPVEVFTQLVQQFNAWVHHVHIF
jgi:hypothetical protein